MAERRMFANQIVMSDAFLDMGASTRALYFALSMSADDDGFVNKPKSIMRLTSASVDDLNVLISKKFVISFESGIIAIKHWRINNRIRTDRYSKTTYQKELSTLFLDENGAYSTNQQPADNQSATKAQPLVNHLSTNWQPTVGVVKDSIVKYKKENTKRKKKLPDFEMPVCKGNDIEKLKGELFNDNQ